MTSTDGRALASHCRRVAGPQRRLWGRVSKIAVFETAYLHLTFIDKFTWHLVAAALVLPPNGRYATMRTIDQRTLVEKR